MSFDDELQRSLQGLEADLYAAKMPGPAAARKRAAQRTRNKVVGTVLGGMAAVAAGAVIALQPFMPTANEGPPAITPTPTESETQTTTPTPTQEPTTTTPAGVPDDALMTADDILNNAAEVASWQASDPPAERADCVLDIAEYAADADNSKRVWFELPFGGNVISSHAVHQVIRVDADSVGTVFGEIRDRLETCAPQGSGASRGTGIGDEAWLIHYGAELPGAESLPDEGVAWLVDVAIVRQDDVISMTAVYHAATEAIAPDVTTPVNATQRVCEAVFEETCVGEVDFPDIDLEPFDSGEEADPTPPNGGSTHQLADEPFLTNEQMAVDPYTFAISDASAVNPFDEWCLDDPSAFGETAQTRYWTTDLDMSGFETVIQFGSTEEASGWLMDYTIIESRCEASGKGVEEDSSVGGAREITQLDFSNVGSGDDALGWTRSGDGGPETDTFFFGAGVATRGNIGVVVAVGAMSFPEDPTFEDYITQRLDQALERAIE